MNKYLIRLQCNVKGHYEGIAEHKQIFQQCAISYLNYVWQHGSSAPHQPSVNYWAVRCTEEQLTALVLLGAQIDTNLTEVHAARGLAKLTKDEKEALGL